LVEHIWRLVDKNIIYKSQKRKEVVAIKVMTFTKKRLKRLKPLNLQFMLFENLKKQ
jgi:hypothetical protein